MCKFKPARKSHDQEIKILQNNAYPEKAPNLYSYLCGFQLEGRTKN